jgi:holin-like protein
LETNLIEGEKMLEYLTLILACQLLGELAVTSANVPFPGPVAGMVLLFLFLLIKGEIPEALSNVSGALLTNLSLMFVPAGVGVMVHFKLLGSDALPLSLALIFSTLLTIVITAMVMLILNRKIPQDMDRDG